MKRVVVTGSTSMMGVAFLKQCVENHVEVLALVRPNSSKISCIPNSKLIQVIPCDLSSMSTLEAKYSTFDAFYHFGWSHTEHEKRNDAVLQNENIGFTLDAVCLAQRFGCKTFIGAGSQAEYGRFDHKISPDEPVHPESAYGVAKYAACRLSSILCGKLGICHLWGRIFSTYGFYDNKNTMLMYSIDALLKSQKPSFTKCEQQWDYLFCDDAAEAFYCMGERGKDQTIYNIGSGKTRPLHEYISILHDAINSNLPLGTGEKPYAPNQVMYLCADISNLTEDTGFVPHTTFEEGIAKTVQWYRGEFI